jgi:probable O-glycosylation ligase (exosortase A-associated)
MRILFLPVFYYGCVLYALANPWFGLLFFVHITIFRPDSLVWGDLIFGRLHLITAIAVVIGYLLHRGKKASEISERLQNINLAIFATFVLWLFAVSVQAESSVQLSLDQTIGVAKIFLLCFLFARLMTTRDLISKYVWVVSVSFGLLSFWGFLQGLAGNERLDTLWPGGSNYIAAQLALVTPLVFSKTFDPTLSQKSKLLLLACTTSNILCCLYTGSRGGFLGLAVGMLILILTIKQRIRVLAGLALCLALIYPWIPAGYSSRIDSITSVAEGEGSDLSGDSRFVLWRIALRIWKDHPIAGVGLDNFSPVKESYGANLSDFAAHFADIVKSEEMYYSIFGLERRPHGLYTGMMAESGLVGIALWLLLMLQNLLFRLPASPVKSATGRGMYPQINGARAGLIGFAISALFGDFQYIEMFYVQTFFIGAMRGCVDAVACPSSSQKAESQLQTTDRPNGR